jgi:hypothetical protein
VAYGELERVGGEGLTNEGRAARGDAAAGALGDARPEVGRLDVPLDPPDHFPRRRGYWPPAR